jgi:hypothetical protein
MSGTLAPQSIDPEARINPAAIVKTVAFPYDAIIKGIYLTSLLHREATQDGSFYIELYTLNPRTRQTQPVTRLTSAYESGMPAARLASNSLGDIDFFVEKGTLIYVAAGIDTDLADAVSYYGSIAAEVLIPDLGEDGSGEASSPAA